MKCRVCNFELYLGKNPSHYFCLKCENLEILDKETSIKIIEKEIQTNLEKVKKYTSKFDTSRLLFDLIDHRENLLVNFFERQKFEIENVPSLNLYDIIRSSILIRAIYEFGPLKQDDKKDRIENLTLLFQKIEDYMHCLWSRYTIKEEFSDFIEYNDKIKEEREKKKDYAVEYNGKKYVLKYKVIWLDVLNNYRQFHCSTFEEAEEEISEIKREESIAREIGKIDKEELTSPIKPTTPNLLRLYNQLQVCMNAVSPDPTLIQFDEIEKSKELVSFLFNLASLAINEKKKDNYPYNKENFFTCFSKKQIELIFNSYGLTSLYLYLMLVSYPGYIKDIPLLLDLNDRVLVPSNFLRLIASYLSYFAYKKEITNENIGLFFQTKVEKKLKSIGFSILFKNKILKNSEGKKREYDLIAQKNHTIFLIECKDRTPRQLHFGKKQREEAFVEIKEEIDNKTFERIDIFKENISNLGIKLRKDGIIEAIIITKLDYLLNDYQNIRIIPYGKLDSILK